jgi:hypothetical protein
MVFTSTRALDYREISAAKNVVLRAKPVGSQVLRWVRFGSEVGPLCDGAVGSLTPRGCFASGIDFST